MNTFNDEMTNIESLEDEMVQLLIDLCSIPAIDPASGGEGELDKAVFLEERLRQMGFSDIERLDVPEEGAKGGVRPNIIVTIPGRRQEYGIYDRAY